MGDTGRVFTVMGGPNLQSNVHPVGNVWSECFPTGSLSMEPHTPHPPGSERTDVFDLEVAGTDEGPIYGEGGE